MSQGKKASVLWNWTIFTNFCYCLEEAQYFATQSLLDTIGRTVITIRTLMALSKWFLTWILNILDILLLQLSLWQLKFPHISACFIQKRCIVNTPAVLEICVINHERQEKWQWVNVKISEKLERLREHKSCGWSAVSSKGETVLFDTGQNLICLC